MKYSPILFSALVLTLLLFVGSCKTEEKKNLPDVSSINIEMKWTRFEQELFYIDTIQFKAGLQNLKVKYPEFTDIYFNQILGTGNTKTIPEGEMNYLRGFVTYPNIKKLYDTTQIVFAGMKSEKEEFKKAFQYLKHYFPERYIPSVTTFLSEYTIGIFVYGKGDLGVGLDFFLGPKYDYRYYNGDNSNFSNYLIRTYNKDHLVSKSMYAVIDDITGNKPQQEKLINFILHEGKKLYVLDQIMPLAQDSVKLEFSKIQLNWLNQNEKNIWAFFTSEKLLYESDYDKIRKYIEPSPNSPGMPAEAPGRVGTWLGYQIVKSFMKNNPQITLNQLIAITDAQQLLEKSRYKP